MLCSMTHCSVFTSPEGGEHALVLAAAELDALHAARVGVRREVGQGGLAPGQAGVVDVEPGVGPGRAARAGLAAAAAGAAARAAAGVAAGAGDVVVIAGTGQKQA